MSRYEQFSVTQLRVGEVLGLDGAAQSTTTNIGAVNGATVSAVEQGNGLIHRTVLTLTTTPITVADDAGVAQYGGAGKIYDFPTGGVSILGGSIVGSCTMGATGTFIDNWTGVISVGSAAASTGVTLAATEADMVASMVVDAGASDKIGVVDSASNNVVALAGKAKDAYLNIAIADDATHTAGTGTFTGTVTIIWMSL